MGEAYATAFKLLNLGFSVIPSGGGMESNVGEVSIERPGPTGNEGATGQGYGANGSEAIN